MSEIPRYDPAPTNAAPGQAPAAPRIMNTVFFMLLGAAALQVISAILGVIYSNSDAFRTQLVDQLEAQNVGETTSDMVEVGVLAATGGIIVVAVIAVILYVLIGLFLKKGMGWARIVGTVLAVASLSQLIGLTMPGGIATILQILLGIGAMVLCFTGPASAYFAQKKQFKLASKGH